MLMSGVLQQAGLQCFVVTLLRYCESMRGTVQVAAAGQLLLRRRRLRLL
jgi:hypothetical protein